MMPIIANVDQVIHWIRAGSHKTEHDERRQSVDQAVGIAMAVRSEQGQEHKQVLDPLVRNSPVLLLCPC